MASTPNFLYMKQALSSPRYKCNSAERLGVWFYALYFFVHASLQLLCRRGSLLGIHHPNRMGICQWFATRPLSKSHFSNMFHIHAKRFGNKSSRGAGISHHFDRFSHSNHLLQAPSKMCTQILCKKASMRKSCVSLTIFVSRLTLIVPKNTILPRRLPEIWKLWSFLSRLSMGNSKQHPLSQVIVKHVSAKAP